MLNKYDVRRFVAFYLLIMIVQRCWFFCECNCIFYGGHVSCWA